MSFYQQWGFCQNPFDTTALPANDAGRKLLVGRDIELAKFVKALRNPPRVATLEGANGVGKTSLANVAAYHAYQQYCKTGVGPLLIPCNRPFQLASDSKIEELVLEVLMEVAQTLISRQADIRNGGRAPGDLKALDRWLNSPQVTGWQASGGFLSTSAGIGRSGQANEAIGFEKSGFRREVLTALADIFGAGEGVVCIIDNLELLETSEQARRTLEQLRDALFSVPGLRWVLAGAAGIVNGVASSPRLEGYLAQPVEIRGIDPIHAPEILSSRIAAFAVNAEEEPYLPLLPEDFAGLYRLLAFNIRSSLGRADNYCSSVSGDPPHSDDEKNHSYKIWLNEECTAALRAVERLLTPRAWQVFDRACESDLAGYFSPSEYEEFGFKDMANLRPYIQTLEGAGLVATSRDEVDKRRKTIQVVAKGWLVANARRGAN